MFSCGRSTETNVEKKKVNKPIVTVEGEADTTISTQINQLKIDSVAINSYTALLDSANPYEQNIIESIIQNIEEYKSKEFTDEVLTVGEIDGIGNVDTIKTYIEVKSGNVNLRSIWIRNGNLMWEYKINNPYMALNQLSYDDSDIWMKWTIARNYTLPELNQRLEYPQIEDNWVVYFGTRDLELQSVEESTYKEYISKFKGEVLEYGDPENRKLVIWYEPAEKFVTYYAP